jgi:hypothetical protein
MNAARLGLVFAAAVGGVVLSSGPASAACSSTCYVGGSGIGGVSSDGSASGFHYQEPAPSTLPDTTVTNSGSANSGHIGISGANTGSANGAFTPQEVIVGHYTGLIAENWFGSTETCNGVCG